MIISIQQLCSFLYKKALLNVCGKYCAKTRNRFIAKFFDQRWRANFKANLGGKINELTSIRLVNQSRTSLEKKIKRNKDATLKQGCKSTTRMQNE